MIRGLVIGKFLPVHSGHIALIRLAAEKCDELIVSMSYRNNDPIGHKVRFSWLQAIFADDDKIIMKMIPDDFDDETLPWPERTKIWGEVIRKIYPPFDILVSSEDYGQHFAEHLGAKNIQYDTGRIAMPVSASKIRAHPFKYWEFIPDVVKPWFTKKICFYGPESTGKTLMTEAMAVHFQTNFVPEVAREFLVTNDFSEADIIEIGKAHLDRIMKNAQSANKLLLVDTDAITTQIYSQYYLGTIPPILFELEKAVRFDHYFLFDIDVPWVADGLRDLGFMREEMFLIFKNELEKRGIPYTLVSGSWEKRKEIVIQALRSLISE